MRKKLKPLTEPRALVHATCLSQLGELKFSFFEKIGPAGRVTLLWRAGEKGMSPFLAEASFCMSCNRLTMFSIRKCMKRWLARGSPRRVESPCFYLELAKTP